jgi:signal transduction histidine kinase
MPFTGISIVTTVRIERQGERIHLPIEDNGQGFATGFRTSDPVHGGFGLTGMAERTALLGGALKIHAELERGTAAFVACACFTVF